MHIDIDRVDNGWIVKCSTIEHPPKIVIVPDGSDDGVVRAIETVQRFMGMPVGAQTATA